jgi:hypothetical protein
MEGLYIGYYGFHIIYVLPRQTTKERMKTMKIRNINGTSDTTCSCGSWLAHWEKFSGQSTKFCQADGCLNKDLLGAHVQKGGGSTDQKWYIYPLCGAHNKHSGELEVSSSYKLVSANKSETCG